MVFESRVILSKYARIPPSFAGGMNGLPSPLPAPRLRQAGIKGEESFLEN